MKEIVILSGKGGTGKTCITAALADVIARESRVILADADVDASNLGLICEPITTAEHQFFGGRIAAIDPKLCTACGLCAEVCRFDAVQPMDGYYSIHGQNCEGCDACVHQCPEKAIISVEQQAGLWFRSTSSYGPLFHAHLFAGAENSGKLVATVKRHARELGETEGYGLLLVDGPPGTGCPVISAISGVHLALLVTEPSIAAIHDLDRIHGLLRHFSVPVAVVLNKADLFEEGSARVRSFCNQHELELLCEVPFDTAVPDAMASGVPITRFAGDSLAAAAIEQGWSSLKALL